MTPNDLITLALKQAGATGVGQTPLAEDMNDAFTVLNMMIGQWNRKRWLIYHLVDVALPATGALSYTIGTGGLFNVARPDRIEAAYVRVLTNAVPYQVDYPLRVLPSREDWDLVALKQQPGFPSLVFYDANYPLGTVYIWPVPSSSYEIHLILKETLAGFTDLAQDLSLPPEYQEALFYNLAGRLRPMYGMPPEPTITALARASLNTIRNANAQVPLLQMPRELTRGWHYNVYSDRMQ